MTSPSISPTSNQTAGGNEGVEPPTVTRIPLIAAVGLGIAGIAVVLLVDSVGLLRGPVAVILLGIIWLLVPSAATLSRRVALNGAIGLGAFPVLWWVKWPTFGMIGHVGVVLALLVGYLVFRFFRGGIKRRSLLPVFSRLDWIPAAAALFCAWFFLPFLRYRSGVASISLLMNAFGSDNVGHFDMFSMIRRSGVTGPLWGDGPGNAGYAYVNYPQHFHVLVVFAAELWHGPAVGSVDTETGLFGLGTAIVLSVAFITLIAGISALGVFRRRAALGVVAASGALSFLLLGSGAATLPYGFAGFLLAIIGIIIAYVIVMDTRRASKTLLAASGSLFILSANSWSLLAPLTVVPLLFVLYKMPWRRYLARCRELVAVGAILVVTVGGVLYAAVLVLAATTGADSSPEAALTTEGALPTLPLTLTLSTGLALLAVAIGWLAKRPIDRRPWGSAGLTVLLVLLVFVETSVLVVIQLKQETGLSYFQLKFIFAATLIFAVLLVLIAAARVASASLAAEALAAAERSLAEPADHVLADSGSPQGRSPGETRFRVVTARGGSVLAAILMTVSILAYSGLPTVPNLAFAGLRAPGAIFRGSLEAAAVNPSPSTSRILAAATLMRTSPCVRPIYFAAMPGDPPLEEANQWAMSFSGTWTQSAAVINTYLDKHHPGMPGVSDAKTIMTLLEAHPERCVIVAHAVKHNLPPSVTDRFGERILSWN
jgi:hypothetical protein